MTRTQFETTPPTKNVGVIYYMAESFFFVAKSFFYGRSQINLGRSLFFFGGDADYKLTPTEITLTPPQHITVLAEKKTTQPKKTGGVIFVWDGNILISGGVVRENLVPPVHVMTPTEEIMTQPKKNGRVQKKMVESSKIGVESFRCVAET